MKLILATNNPGKLREMRAILSGKFDEILSAREAGITHETVEDGTTFSENAQKKAREFSALSGCAALADDSGICVDALNGAPGVYSARYAGSHGDDAKNNEKLLREMEGKTDRKAHYACAMCLHYPDGREITSVGEWHGEIAFAPSGTGGFGYDPYFYLPEYGCTAASLPPEEKNRVSHRARALAALLEKL